MNLIGTRVAVCCHKVIEFCVLSQKLYNFYTKFTHRYEILEGFAEPRTMSLKSLSNTRWAVRADATLDFKKHWREITQALVLIGNYVDEKSITRNTANDL